MNDEIKDKRHWTRISQIDTKREKQIDNSPQRTQRAQRKAENRDKNGGNGETQINAKVKSKGKKKGIGRREPR